MAKILIAKVDEYMDQAFNTDDPNKRQKLREAIQQMEKLLLTVSSIEQFRAHAGSR